MDQNQRSGGAGRTFGKADRTASDVSLDQEDINVVYANGLALRQSLDPRLTLHPAANALFASRPPGSETHSSIVNRLSVLSDGAMIWPREMKSAMNPREYAVAASLSLSAGLEGIRTLTYHGSHQASPRSVLPWEKTLAKLPDARGYLPLDEKRVNEFVSSRPEAGESSKATMVRLARHLDDDFSLSPELCSAMTHQEFEAYVTIRDVIVDSGHQSYDEKSGKFMSTLDPEVAWQRYQILGGSHAPDDRSPPSILSEPDRAIGLDPKVHSLLASRPLWHETWNDTRSRLIDLSHGFYRFTDAMKEAMNPQEREVAKTLKPMPKYRRFLENCAPEPPFSDQDYFSAVQRLPDARGFRPADNALVEGFQAESSARKAESFRDTFQRLLKYADNRAELPPEVVAELSVDEQEVYKAMQSLEYERYMRYTQQANPNTQFKGITDYDVRKHPDYGWMMQELASRSR